MENNVKRIYKHITNWAKIFTNNISDKGLISRTYEELSKFSNKKSKQFKKIVEQKSWVDPFTKKFTLIVGM